MTSSSVMRVDESAVHPPAFPAEPRLEPTALGLQV